MTAYTRHATQTNYVAWACTLCVSMTIAMLFSGLIMFIGVREYIRWSVREYEKEMKIELEEFKRELNKK